MDDKFVPEGGRLVSGCDGRWIVTWEAPSVSLISPSSRACPSSISKFLGEGTDGKDAGVIDAEMSELATGAVSGA